MNSVELHLNDVMLFQILVKRQLCHPNSHIYHQHRVGKSEKKHQELSGRGDRYRKQARGTLLVLLVKGLFGFQAEMWRKLESLL